MVTDYFAHPHRFPKNVDGPFYTTGTLCRAPHTSSRWCADCLQCEAPEAEAPELLAVLSDDNYDTYFVRQPVAVDEVSHACMAARVCCTSALRYGGKDQDIIKQLGNDPAMCDYIVVDGSLRLTVGHDGELLPFAQCIADGMRVRAEHKHQEGKKKWWQFWC